MGQIGNVDPSVARDIALHANLWLVQRRDQALRWINTVSGDDITADDIDLVCDILLAACDRD